MAGYKNTKHEIKWIGNLTHCKDIEFSVLTKRSQCMYLNKGIYGEHLLYNIYYLGGDSVDSFWLLYCIVVASVVVPPVATL